MGIEPVDAFGQPGWIAGSHVPAGSPVLHQPRQAGAFKFRHQSWFAHGHGFEHADAEGFGPVERGQADQVALAEQKIPHPVRYAADQMNARLESQFGNQTLQPRSLGALADDGQLGLSLRHGPDQHVQALVGGESAHAQNAQVFPAVPAGTDRARITPDQALGVETQRYHAALALPARQRAAALEVGRRGHDDLAGMGQQCLLERTIKRIEQAYHAVELGGGCIGLPLDNPRNPPRDREYKGPKCGRVGQMQVQKFGLEALDGQVQAPSERGTDRGVSEGAPGFDSVEIAQKGVAALILAAGVFAVPGVDDQALLGSEVRRC